MKQTRKIIESLPVPRLCGGKSAVMKLEANSSSLQFSCQSPTWKKYKLREKDKDGKRCVSVTRAEIQNNRIMSEFHLRMRYLYDQ